MSQQNLATISRKQIEGLLREWANVPGEWPMTEYEDQYRKMFAAVDRLCSRYPGVFGDSDRHGIIVLREFLRKLWNAPDARHRDWYIFKFRDVAQKMSDRIPAVRSGTFSRLPLILPASLSEVEEMVRHCDPSELTPLEAVGSYLPSIAKWMRLCANPECDTPFLIAKKKASKYCDDDCALPAQRAAKLRWWRENRQKKTRGASKTKHKGKPTARHQQA
jgi:hypothetical protein